MHGRLITKIAGQRIFGVRVDEVTAAGCGFYSSSSALYAPGKPTIFVLCVCLLPNMIELLSDCVSSIGSTASPDEPTSRPGSNRGLGYYLLRQHDRRALPLLGDSGETLRDPVASDD